MSADGPDDGIPILTDVVDARLPSLPRPLARDNGPITGFPNSGFGAGSIPGAVPLSRSGPTTGIKAAPPAAGPKAPPISGPPSLSEFGGSDDLAMPSAPAKSADAFAMRVEAAVLERLMQRLDPVLETRLKENLSDLLEKVLADMLNELKYSARGIIRDAVAQAVADEIAAQRGNPPKI